MDKEFMKKIRQDIKAQEKLLNSIKFELKVHEDRKKDIKRKKGHKLISRACENIDTINTIFYLIMHYKQSTQRQIFKGDDE